MYTFTYYSIGTRVFGNHTLYRIKALKNFSDVKAGTLGGFIESESNLSHDGNRWVYDNTLVLNPAHIYENAKVFNHAIIMGLVYGSEKLSGSARIHRNAVVYDHVCVYGNAHVHDHARVYKNSRIYNYARVSPNIFFMIYGHSKVSGSVYGNAKISGFVKVWGRAL